MSEQPKQVIKNAEDVINVSWHALQADEVLDSLDVPVETGLSDVEVKERLEKFGYNELQEQAGRTFLQKLWEQINSFVIWLLIGAAVISAVLGDWVEAGAILLIVVLNAIMGIIQESRAEASLAALKRWLPPKPRFCAAVTASWCPRGSWYRATLSSSKQVTLFQPTFASWMPSI